jgi:hypothetical protein
LWKKFKGWVSHPNALAIEPERIEPKEKIPSLKPSPKPEPSPSCKNPLLVASLEREPGERIEEGADKEKGEEKKRVRCSLRGFIKLIGQRI